MLSCISVQEKFQERKKTVRVAVIPFQNSQNTKENSFGILLNSTIISTINISSFHRYVDEEFEKYYIYTAMRIAQKIGDTKFENLLKELIQIHGRENPRIDIYITGYYFFRGNQAYVHVKFLDANGVLSEFQMEWRKNSIELFRRLSQKIALKMEPENLEAIEYLETGFQLTKNFDAYKLYLEGKEEKRKNTIYGYMNAIRKFRDSQRKDGLYIMPLNEIVHTISQISSDLLELKKHEKIVNNRNVISDADFQLSRNADIIQNSISLFTNAKTARPEEYQEIQEVYEKSPYKEQYELKTSKFKNQMEMLLLRWENENFNSESVIKGKIQGINNKYAPLLITDFFQTLTGSKINMNDILRAIIKYSKDHPEDRYFIHYFKNFTRLIKTLNEFEFMRLNPEANFSYHQLHQEYVFYVREYLKVMREGL